jgi:hypothetical protein
VGTPCEAVVTDRRLCHVPDNVIALFPDDPSLADLGAASYMGVPLLDTDGDLLGHLAVLPHSRFSPAVPLVPFGLPVRRAQIMEDAMRSKTVELGVFIIYLGTLLASVVLSFWLSGAFR